MFTCGCIVLSLPKRAHVDWNWPISREKYLKRVRSVKCRCICLLSQLQAPSDGLLILSLVFDILLANNAKKTSNYYYYYCYYYYFINIIINDQVCLSADLAPFPGQVAVLTIPGTPLERKLKDLSQE